RKVGPAQARELRVQVREQAALQQRIVGEINARRHIGRAEGDLLGLGKKVVRPAVQGKAANLLERNHLFRNDLGRVQVVIGQGIGLFLREQLHQQIPGRRMAGFNRLEQVTAVVVVVGRLQLGGLVPDGGL